MAKTALPARASFGALSSADTATDEGRLAALEGLARMETRLRLRMAMLCLTLSIGLGVGAQGARATDLSGCWRGTWQSCTTDHQGNLSATFRRVNAVQYDVEFRGTFFKLLPFRYNVTLDVVGEDGQTMYLAGSSDLGRLFGVFRYKAQVTACEFRATYSSCEDTGQFVMSRVCCPRPR